MQNTNKRVASYFVLGAIVAQGAASITFTDAQDSGNYIPQVSANSELSQDIISDEVSLTGEISLSELKEMVEAREAELASIELEAAAEEIVEDALNEELWEEDTIVEEELEEEKKEETELSLTEKAELAATEITDAQLLKIFVQNKTRFADNAEFIETWKTLSASYSQKQDTEVFAQKVVFLTIYLELSQGNESTEAFSLEYKGIANSVFESNIMAYLDSRDATEAQYSNARKLVKMVEMYNELPENQAQKKVDMQKSLITQFGRVLR